MKMGLMLPIADHYTFSLSTSEILTAAGLAITVLGAMWVLNGWLIDRRVDVKLEETVQDAVKRHVEIVDTKMDTMLINQRETSAALGRVHDLEVTINNGLSAKVSEIDRKLDQVIEHQLGWGNGSTN